MTDAGNPLESYFRANSGRLIHKWVHYFEIYHRHFSPFRDRSVTILEIGVSHGGSLQMWQDYFGPKARIIGVDVDPRCAALGGGQVEIILGDQDDRAFLRELRTKVGPIDILIEDGGHTMSQQIRTFEEMWPGIRDGGVYLAEDLHTSYWAAFGGGFGRPNTFIEYAKRLMDQMNAWHSEDADALRVDSFTSSLAGMHVYDSVIVLDKGVVEAPHHEMTGYPTLAEP